MNRIIFLIALPIFAMETRKVDHDLIRSIMQNDYPKVVDALQKGANIHCQKEGPIICAAAHASPRIIKLLLTYGANFNIMYDNKHTPLYYAIGNSKILNIITLLNHGVSVHGLPGDEAPIYTAAFKGDIRLVKILVSYGALIEKSDDKQTPFYQYFGAFSYPWKKNKEFFNQILEGAVFFLEHGANPALNPRYSVTNLIDKILARELKNERLKKSARRLDLSPEVLRLMVKNLVAHYRMFFHLLKNKNIDAAMAITKTCSILRNLKDYETGNTLLHYCAQSGHEEYFADIFIRNPKAITYKNKNGQTPIHLLFQTVPGQKILNKLIILGTKKRKRDF